MHTRGGSDPSTSCCAPSIASLPLCRADSTPLLLALRAACMCDGDTAPTGPLAIAAVAGTVGMAWTVGVAL